MHIPSRLLLLLLVVALVGACGGSNSAPTSPTTATPTPSPAPSPSPSPSVPVTTNPRAWIDIISATTFTARVQGRDYPGSGRLFLDPTAGVYEVSGTMGARGLEFSNLGVFWGKELGNVSGGIEMNSIQVLAGPQPVVKPCGVCLLTLAPPPADFRIRFTITSSSQNVCASTTVQCP